MSHPHPRYKTQLLTSPHPSSPSTIFLFSSFFLSFIYMLSVLYRFSSCQWLHWKLSRFLSFVETFSSWWPLPFTAISPSLFAFIFAGCATAFLARGTVNVHWVHCQAGNALYDCLLPRSHKPAVAMNTSPTSSARTCRSPASTSVKTKAFHLYFTKKLLSHSLRKYNSIL